MIPTHDGFLVLGYVVAVILFFSVGAYVERLRDVLLVTAWAVADLRGDDPVDPRRRRVLGSLLVVLGPVVAGRIVAVQRAQTQRLQRLTAELPWSGHAPSRPPSPRNGPASPASCTTSSATR